jgi:flagellar protein FlaI
LFPKKLRQACKENPFLDDYMRNVPVDEIGVPDYYSKLTRNLKDLEERNLIYPIEGGLFVHVYPDPSGARDILARRRRRRKNGPSCWKP